VTYVTVFPKIYCFDFAASSSWAVCFPSLTRAAEWRPSFFTRTKSSKLLWLEGYFAIIFMNGGSISGQTAHENEGLL